MVRIGATPTAEEEASLHHLYRWVGYVMGITPDLLTVDREEEKRLHANITRRQLHPDADSRVLAKSLIDALAGRRPTFLPGDALSVLARRMLGDEFSDQLGLRPSRAWSTMIEALPLFSRAQLRVERGLHAFPARAPG
ncbi:MAG: oxygenase MpaB family protein [Archangium sp.]|nr:oxygenase MpaB family protein [Archangium sp.]